MSRRASALTLDTFDQIAEPCRSCVFWELDPVAAARSELAGDPLLDKEAWVSGTLLAWGSCGTLVHVDGEPAGFALYAPPAHVPRASSFPTAPVSPDAVLLTALRVLPGHEAGGVGRMLVQGMVRDLSRRGVRAIEAFGDARAGRSGPGEPSTCVVPADFLLAVGFKTVRPHRRWPRLRMDLRGVLAWRDEAGAVIERVLGGRVPVPAPAFEAGTERVG